MQICRTALLLSSPRTCAISLMSIRAESLRRWQLRRSCATSCGWVVRPTRRCPPQCRRRSPRVLACRARVRLRPACSRRIVDAANKRSCVQGFCNSVGCMSVCDHTAFASVRMSNSFGPLTQRCECSASHEILLAIHLPPVGLASHFANSYGGQIEALPGCSDRLLVKMRGATVHASRLGSALLLVCSREAPAGHCSAKSS